MKHIITMLCLLLFAAFAMAQERKFISTCGKTQTAIHDIRLQRFVAEQNFEGKNVFIFSTRCCPLLGAYHKPLRNIIERKGGMVVGEFSCRGYDRT